MNYSKNGIPEKNFSEKIVKRKFFVILFKVFRLNPELNFFESLVDLFQTLLVLYLVIIAVCLVAGRVLLFVILHRGNIYIPILLGAFSVPLVIILGTTLLFKLNRRYLMYYLCFVGFCFLSATQLFIDPFFFEGFSVHYIFLGIIPIFYNNWTQFVVFPCLFLPNIANLVLRLISIKGDVVIDEFSQWGFYWISFVNFVNSACVILIAFFYISFSLNSYQKIIRIIERNISTLGFNKNDELTKILNTNYGSEITLLLKRIVEYMEYYKSFIPKKIYDKRFRRKRIMSSSSQESVTSSKSGSRHSLDGASNKSDSEKEIKIGFERFDFGVKKKYGTVVCVMVDNYFKEEKSEIYFYEGVLTYTEINKLVEECSLELNGSVLSVEENTILVGFNIDSDCKQHSVSAGRFCLNLRRSIDLLNEKDTEFAYVNIWFGISTGRVYEGIFGTKNNKKIRVFGKPHSLSYILANYAKNKSRSIVLSETTSVFIEDDFEYQPIDILFCPKITTENITIFELTKIKQQRDKTQWQALMMENIEKDEKDIEMSIWKVFLKNKLRESLEMIEKKGLTSWIMTEVIKKMINRNITIENLIKENKERMKYFSSEYVPLLYIE